VTHSLQFFCSEQSDLVRKADAAACHDKRVLTIKTVIVMTLFPSCDLLLGTDFGDLYDAVHCFKRAQATLVDLWPPSGKPEVFGMGRGVTSIPFHDLVTTRQSVLDAAPQEPGPPRITINEIRDVSRRLKVAQQRYDQAKADLAKAKAAPMPAPTPTHSRRTIASLMELPAQEGDRIYMAAGMNWTVFSAERATRIAAMRQSGQKIGT
jgi:hypothetical protein